MYFTKIDKQRETIGRVTQMDLPLWSNLMEKKEERMEVRGTQKGSEVAARVQYFIFQNYKALLFLLLYRHQD